MWRWVGISLTIGLLALTLGAGEEVLDEPSRIGVPYDWSHHHVIFSQPATFQRLGEVQRDPRYWQQLYRGIYRQTAIRRAVPSLPRSPVLAGPEDGVDWSESLSTTALTFGNLAVYPAKYSFNSANPTPNCTNDYVVFTVPTGTATKANLYAFKNLYVNNAGTGTCTGTTPTALFGYNASQSTGTLNSSPVLSLDGTKIAFIENSTSAQFHVLKWHAGDTSGTAGSPFNSSVMANCATNGGVAPCEYSLAFTTHTAAISSPYVDYATDTAYVTDDAGMIAAISPVFGSGTPALVYSKVVSGATQMTAPVYDSTSKNVFAADKKGFLYYVRTSASSVGTCASGSPPCIGGTTLNVGNTKQIFDAPIIDASTGMVYTFSNNGPTSANSSVIQATTALLSSRVATIGPTTNQNVYSGVFNNAYYSSPGTGLLYACGAASGNKPQLFAISFTGSLMNTGAAANGPLAVSTAATACSPLNQVLNTSNSKEYIFLSVATKCSATITGGCVEEYDITSGFPSATAGAVAETGGTTGIIIDNVSNGVSGNASQTNFYFGTQRAQSCSTYTGGTSSAGNCLVKLTQVGLQ